MTTELGYAPRAIAHAFSTLSGPGTVDEALEVLKRMSRPEPPPIALSFEITETRGGPSLPPRPATMVRIRIRCDGSQVRMPWDAPPRSIWERPAHEVRVSLTG